MMLMKKMKIILMKFMSKGGKNMQEIFVEPVEVKNPKVHADHYNDTQITPFDIIDDWRLDFYLGNTIEYIKRAGNKNGESVRDDLEKAIDYLKEELKRL